MSPQETPLVYIGICGIVESVYILYKLKFLGIVKGVCRPPQRAVGLFFYYFFAVFPDGSQVGCFQAADGRLARAEKCG